MSHSSSPNPPIPALLLLSLFYYYYYYYHCYYCCCCRYAQRWQMWPPIGLLLQRRTKSDKLHESLNTVKTVVVVVEANERAMEGKKAEGTTVSIQEL